ncbi:MAG: nucleotidyltransferase domain-containing protein [Candidatus Sumerlaeia bacterium]|nr:nucleotidyltransferase domain-containing protein [Candidatus Sumerlaeia bacterium]
MLPVSDRLINDLVEKLSRDLEDLEEIILFGSRGRGEDDQGGDVDLLLVFDTDFSSHGNSRWDYVKRVRQARSPFPIPVDFRVFSLAEMTRYSKLPNHMVAVALDEGRTLYRRNGVAAVA